MHQCWEPPLLSYQCLYNSWARMEGEPRQPKAAAGSNPPPRPRPGTQAQGALLAAADRTWESSVPHPTPSQRPCSTARAFKHASRLRAPRTTEAVWLSKPHLASVLTPTWLLQQQMEEITTGVQQASKQGVQLHTAPAVWEKLRGRKHTKPHTKIKAPPGPHQQQVATEQSIGKRSCFLAPRRSCF